MNKEHEYDVMSYRGKLYYRHWLKNRTGKITLIRRYEE